MGRLLPHLLIFPSDTLIDLSEACLLVNPRSNQTDKPGDEADFSFCFTKVINII